MDELFTKKIYYRKYDHRLVIKCRNGRHNDILAPTGEVVTWLLNQDYKDAWRGISSYGYVDKIQYFTVFFKNPAIFDYIKERIKPQFLTEYEKPMDEQHTEMLEKEKVVVRKQLFHNKYRIAIRCEPINRGGRWDTTHMQEMKKWCELQYGREYDNKDRYKMSGWHNTSFFFADPKDAVMFKLVHQDIKRTERCVLVSEMEAARTPKTSD